MISPCSATSCTQPRANSRPQLRGGLTIVELLVVIAIIGMLVGLLLPALLSVRESVRAAVCKNNLRQISLALHSHHDAKRYLPSGWIGEPPDEEPGWAWSSALLPYIEQDHVYTAIDFKQPIGAPVNGIARETAIPIFQCPADRSPTTFQADDHNGTTLTLGRSNYAGVFGSTEVDDSPDNGGGVFFRNSRIRMRQITDGLSRTILVGERSSRLDYTTWVGVISDDDTDMERVVGTTETVPNDVLGHFASFGSHHTQTSHFIMGTGSTISISYEIDLEVFQSLSTRAGGEAVSYDDSKGKGK